MNRIVSRWPHLLVTVLLVYVVVSLVPSSVWNANRMTVALILGSIAVAFILYFKWLRNRLTILYNWPNPVINSRIRRYLLLRDYTPRTAVTRIQVLLSLLIPFLTLLLLVTASSTATLFLPVSDRFREIVSSVCIPLLLGCVFLIPILHGLVFRLRAKYDLKNALLSIVLYLPIFVFALFVLTHLTTFFGDDEAPILSFSSFEVLLAGYFGAIVCILTVATHRVGIDPLPPPSITAQRFYQRTEIAISLGSLTSIAIVAYLA